MPLWGLRLLPKASKGLLLLDLFLKTYFYWKLWPFQASEGLLHLWGPFEAWDQETSCGWMPGPTYSFNYPWFLASARVPETLTDAEVRLCRKLKGVVIITIQEID